METNKMFEIRTIRWLIGEIGSIHPRQQDGKIRPAAEWNSLALYIFDGIRPRLLQGKASVQRRALHVPGIDQLRPKTGAVRQPRLGGKSELPRSRTLSAKIN